MDELDKARANALSGEVRDRWVTRFRDQIGEWGIALPATEPLVADFGLGQFESVGLVEVWIANERDAGYCGKYLFVFDGQTCPMHHHKRKHETFFMMEGRVAVVHEGEAIELRKGDLLPVPTSTRHSFTGIGPALLLELSQPCVIDDNYFDNTQIPIGGNYRGKGA